MTQRDRLLILCLCLVVLAIILACGPNAHCYSQFEGCDATAMFIATAAVLP